MSIEGIRARIDRLLADLNRLGNTRSAAAGIFDAMVETKAAIATIRDALAATDRELIVERQRLADAQRRGRLAEEIQDTETAELAGIWVAKHGERVDLLERKRVVQLDELSYAERQLEEMTEHYRKARAGLPPTAPSPAADAAEYDQLQRQAEREHRANLVEQQLAELKRKLGKQD